MINYFYRPTLRRIKNAEEKNIVLDCDTSKLAEVLLQAMQVGLMGTGYNYIITNLVSLLLLCYRTKYKVTNYSGIKFVTLQSLDIQQIASENCQIIMVVTSIINEKIIYIMYTVVVFLGSTISIGEVQDWLQTLILKVDIHANNTCLTEFVVFNQFYWSVAHMVKDYLHKLKVLSLGLIRVKINF